MSVFDKETFLSQTVEGEMETKFTPVPINEYDSYIDDIDVKMPDEGSDNSPILLVKHKILDDKLKEELGMEDIIVTDTVFLDVEPDGSLSRGINKNVKLGKYREACGQNNGKAWSPMMMRGVGPLRIKVSHRYNKQTGEGPYAQIDRVAKK